MAKTLQQLGTKVGGEFKTHRLRMDAEEAARIAADSNLQDQIDANATSAAADTADVAADLATETSARIAADAALQTQIDSAVTSIQTDIQSAIDDEVTRATAADADLQDQIDNVVSNVDPAALDSLTEIVTAFQTADSNLDGAITSLASSSSADATAKADQALVDAKAYTDGRETAITAAYEAYADTAEANANDYTDGRETAITAAYTSAISTAKSEAISSAEADATTKADAAEAAAISAAAADATTKADAAEAAAVVTANAYTDGRETAITTAYQSYADAAEAAAVATAAADATTKANAAEANAKAYTDSSVSALVDAAPATLDTLNELAAALGDDANFATTVTNNIGTVASDLSDEVTARTNADSALQAQIDANAASAASAASAVASDLSDETAARIAADAGLQSQIDDNDTDIAALQTAVSGNDTDIAALQTAVSGNDTDIAALQTAVSTAQSTADSKLAASHDMSLTLSGDVSGSATFTNMGNATLSVSVADDSHNHVISNVDGLQSALDGKSAVGHTHAHGDITDWSEAVQDTVGAMVAGNSESGISVVYQDTDGTLDFNVNDPTITLAGDLTGSATMTNLGNVTITASVKDDSHNHTIANVDGLSAALSAAENGAVATANAYTDSAVAGIVDSAPGALNTLNELAAALGDDANFASTVSNQIGTKVTTGTSEYIKSASASNDTITFTRGDGSTFSVATQDADTIYSGWDLYTDGTNRGVISNGENVNFVGGTNVSLSYSSTNNTITINSTDTNTWRGVVDNLTSTSTSSSLTANQGRVLKNLVDTAQATADSKDNYGQWNIAANGTSGSSAITSNNTVTFSGSGATTVTRSGDNIIISSTDTNTDTTYSAGRGLDLSGTQFLLETDLRDSISYIGYDSNDYIQWSNNAWTRVVVNGTERLRVDTAGIDVSGRIVADGDITAYSDSRLKENVEVIDNAIEKVKQVRGVNFDRIDDGSRGTGVIAQELEAVLPEAVHTDEEGMKHVAYGNVVGLLIESIKELNRKVEELSK